MANETQGAGSTSAGGTAGATGSNTQGATGAGDAGAGSATGQSQQATGAGETKSTEAGKTQETQKAAEFSLKLPDGMKDDPGFSEFSKLAQKLGLKSEQAQPFVDLQLAQIDAHAKQVGKWEDATKADKDFGGEKLKENLEKAQKAFADFAKRAGPVAEDFQKILKQTGIGSHPGFWRIFQEVAKAMADDTIRGGTAAGSSGATRTQEQSLRAFYDKSPQMFSKES